VNEAPLVRSAGFQPALLLRPLRKAESKKGDRRNNPHGAARGLNRPSLTKFGNVDPVA